MDDQSILRLYWARSEAAITETAKRFGKLCHTIAYRILRNEPDAEECVNDTYFHAWNAIPPAKPNPLAPYLCKITRNLSLDRYDYNTAGKRNVSLEEAFEELNYCAERIRAAEDAVSEAELGRILSDFLWSCKQEYRIIFVRRYWYGDSVTEISEAMMLSESKVKSVLFRVRSRLRDYLVEKEVLSGERKSTLPGTGRD